MSRPRSRRWSGSSRRWISSSIESFLHTRLPRQGDLCGFRLMYIPRHFEETDVGVLRSLIRAHPLGTWVTPGDGRLIVNHIPFLMHEDRGPFGTLVGHVARANSVWRDF